MLTRMTTAISMLDPPFAVAVPEALNAVCAAEDGGRLTSALSRLVIRPA